LLRCCTFLRLADSTQQLLFCQVAKNNRCTPFSGGHRCVMVSCVDFIIAFFKYSFVNDLSSLIRSGCFVSCSEQNYTAGRNVVKVLTRINDSLT